MKHTGTQSDKNQIKQNLLNFHPPLSFSAAENTQTLFQVREFPALQLSSLAAGQAWERWCSEAVFEVSSSRGIYGRI
jgi:hypothetical protein